MPSITQAEYARKRGMTRQAVAQAVRAGKVLLDSDGLLDEEQADRDFPPSPKTMALGARSTAVSSYSEARARRESALASLAERDLQVQEGKLVDRALVEHEIGGILLQARTNLVSMTSRLAATLAAETNPTKVRLTLLSEIALALKVVEDLEDHARDDESGLEEAVKSAESAAARSKPLPKKAGRPRKYA